jgi:hypothetical protein
MKEKEYMREAAERQAGVGSPLVQRPTSPVEIEMQGLSEMIGNLHKRVSVLEERLRPALHMEIDKASPGQTTKSTSTGVPLADQLRSVYDSMTLLHNRLDDLIERVAL